VRKKRNKRKKIAQAKNKSTQAQVTQAVLAQKNATIESILFFTQRTHRTQAQERCVRCVRLSGNRALRTLYVYATVFILHMPRRFGRDMFDCFSQDLSRRGCVSL